MGSKERIEKQKEELRIRILDIASEILTTEGIEELTIRKVAAMIEYSPRTIYLYFKDKDDLLQQIIETGFDVSLKKNEEMAIRTDVEPIEKIRFFLRSNIEMTKINPKIYSTVVLLLQRKNYEPGPNQKKLMGYLKNEIINLYKSRNIDLSKVEAALFLSGAFLRGFNMALINMGDKINEVEKQALINKCIDSIIAIVLQK